MLPGRTREHVLTALGATPVVLERLVERFPASAAVWDLVLPGRFTPREHVAHMGDWEEVFYERLRLSVAEELPELPNPDETAMSVEREFGKSDPMERVGVFAERRLLLLAFLKELGGDDWTRAGVHPKNGPMTVEAQAVHVLGHDGYHLDFLARVLIDDAESG